MLSLYHNLPGHAGKGDTLLLPDRKVLSDMAINDPDAFAALAEVAKKAL